MRKEINVLRRILSQVEAADSASGVGIRARIKPMPSPAPPT